MRQCRTTYRLKHPSYSSLHTPPPQLLSEQRRPRGQLEVCLGLDFDAALPPRTVCEGLRLAGPSVLAVSTREPLPVPGAVQSSSTLACSTLKRP